ncbi:uncharacterized protein N7459_006070 [Penicillium hispanicum]|uniref:uncharacterized protein n=1 Tax=Penicillium hispanicum TaxID=1080232 RepID=UPI00253FE603|nr:uncharacterized protein N7459_006070 [Penicillium hispanicum]KAJ5580085.1 hypothetical protein N7459_006070 [Penicillium hispanicum]
MDGQPRTAHRPPSGIPRPVSRLPLPTSTASQSIRPSPSRERLQADPGLDDGRLRRPSYESLLKQPASRYSSQAKSPVRRRNNVPLKQQELPSDIDGMHTPEDVNSTIGDEEVVAPAHQSRGRPRPSLSERTIETLSHIPPSPASVKRQSSFFNGASPIRSPSRTPSNVSNYSRSPSRSSSGQPNGNDLLSQPVSKLRLPSRSRISVASSSGLPEASTTSESPTRTGMPSVKQSTRVGGSASETSASTKKLGSKAIPKVPHVRASPSTSTKSSVSDMGPPERPLHVRKTRKSATIRSTSNASRYVSAASNMEDLTPEQQAENESRKVSKSSTALRESIAKAKAARKAAAVEGKKEPASQTKPMVDSWSGIDVEDPFNQLPKGSNTNVLRKRVEGARVSGTLNIAALSLDEIPKEVVNMYEFDPESTSNWFENVDLVKFIAADNELAQVSNAVFPDIDLEDFDPDSGERGPQFAGLETLDLHGNVLHSLPMGIRRLHHLRFLNLSNNALTMENIPVIMEIPSLVDLKLANNKLQGSFSASVSQLCQLETLDLRSNELTSLPAELGELSCLKTLELGENQLTTLPFEALSKVPLSTLNAPKNKLGGTLIPGSVDSLEKLQFLNIAHNAVEVLAANNMLALPSLHSLFIGVNRIKHMPCISSWRSLMVLSAEDNKLTELPSGLVDLKNVKTVDFTGNDITRLDDKIGLMQSLSLFRIANNPLRERKFLSMDTEDIIRDMRNRCEPDPQDTDDEGSVATQFTLAPETPALESGWRVKPGGVLDRSYSDLTDLGTDKLELINAQDIRCLYLQHNELRLFPNLALDMVAQGLIELDLSHNPLSNPDLLSSSLELPKLQTLNLGAASLSTLEPVLANLQAPSLTFLDVSNNRLAGPLLHIRQTFPDLKTFLASDNQIASLTFEAVQGLQVLDVSNNDIDYLPPKIGLLGPERSPKNWGTGSALRRFEVAGNRFRVPRWQTVAKGTDAILEYLRERIRSHELPEWELEHDGPVDEY